MEEQLERRTHNVQQQASEVSFQVECSEERTQ